MFTHNDERAVIYEIDVREQRIAKRFALGDPPVRSDFEGLFVLEDRFFLVTSDGVLFESLEGDDGERLDYNMYMTGAGRLCEVEGLAANVARTHLLLACKTPRTRELRPWVTLLPWSIEERRLEPDRMIRFPLDAFTEEVKGDEVQSLRPVSGSGERSLLPGRRRAERDFGNLAGRTLLGDRVTRQRAAPTNGGGRLPGRRYPGPGRRGERAQWPADLLPHRCRHSRELTVHGPLAPSAC